MGVSCQYRDYAAEKNKFLENICEKLNEKNAFELKESVAEYCAKFLDYNKSDIENITEKYLLLYKYIVYLFY